MGIKLYYKGGGNDGREGVDKWMKGMMRGMRVVCGWEEW